MTEMMIGTYKLITSDNFDKYLVSVGFNVKMRETFATVTLVTDISRDGEIWSIKTWTEFPTILQNTEIKFRLGEEFNDCADDDSTCTTIITLKGENILVHIQRDIYGDRISKIVREFKDNRMIMTLEGPGNTVATRVFHKQQDWSQVSEPLSKFEG